MPQSQASNWPGEKMRRLQRNQIAMNFPSRPTVRRIMASTVSEITHAQTHPMYKTAMLFQWVKGLVSNSKSLGTTCR
jgi:hypothetical protein